MLGFLKFVMICFTIWMMSIPTNGNIIIPIVFGGYLCVIFLRDSISLYQEMYYNHRYVETNKTYDSNWGWNDDYYSYNTPADHVRTVNTYTTLGPTTYHRRNRSVFSYTDTTAQDIFKEFSKPQNIQSCELVSEPKSRIPWRKTKVKVIKVPKHEETPTTVTEVKTSKAEYIMMENNSTLSDTKISIYEAIISVLNKEQITPTERYYLLQVIPYVDIYQGTVIIYIDKPLIETQKIKEEWINKVEIEKAVKEKLGTSIVEITFADITTPSLLNFYFKEYVKA